MWYPFHYYDHPFYIVELQLVMYFHLYYQGQNHTRSCDHEVRNWHTVFLVMVGYDGWLVVLSEEWEWMTWWMLVCQVCVRVSDKRVSSCTCLSSVTLQPRSVLYNDLTDEVCLLQNSLQSDGFYLLLNSDNISPISRFSLSCSWTWSGRECLGISALSVTQLTVSLH